VADPATAFPLRYAPIPHRRCTLEGLLDSSTLVMLVIGIAAIGVAIPPAVVAMRDMGWIAASAPVRVVATSLDPNAEAPATNAEDRVLLTLRPERATTEGTLEYRLMTFERRLPPDYRSVGPFGDSNSLIWNPGMYKWSASSRLLLSKIYVPLLFVFCVVLGVLIFVAPKETPVVYFATIVSVMIVVMTAFICVLWLRAKKVLTIVDDYRNYLRANEINIGLEMTQPRSMFEKQGVRLPRWDA
jgi:hypothetical protein